MFGTNIYTNGLDCIVDSVGYIEPKQHFVHQ